MAHGKVETDYTEDFVSSKLIANCVLFCFGFCKLCGALSTCMFILGFLNSATQKLNRPTGGVQNHLKVVRFGD